MRDDANLLSSLSVVSEPAGLPTSAPGPAARMVIRKWTVSELEEQTGLLRILARLVCEPQPVQAEVFANACRGPAWPSDLEPPLLEGALLTFRSRPEDVARYGDALLERLEAANRYYLDVILPRLRAQEAARRAKEDERQRIIAQAQLLLDARLESAHGGEEDGAFGRARVAGRATT